jgi:hypothetical protein
MRRHLFNPFLTLFFMYIPPLAFLISRFLTGSVPLILIWAGPSHQHRSHVVAATSPAHCIESVRLRQIRPAYTKNTSAIQLTNHPSVFSSCLYQAVYVYGVGQAFDICQIEAGSQSLFSCKWDRIGACMQGQIYIIARRLVLVHTSVDRYTHTNVSFSADNQLYVVSMARPR